MKYLLHFLAIVALIYTVSSRPSEGKDKAPKEPDNEDYYATNPTEELQNDEDYDGELEDDDESQDGPITMPTIKSQPINRIVDPGETIQLPCETQNSDDYVTSWYKGSKHDPIFHGSIPLKGTHYSVSKDSSNKSLIIHEANSNDTSDYICSINMANDKIVELTHNIQVRTPAKIVSLAAAHNVTTIEAGKTLVLKCKAEGIPMPKITWSRGGNRIHGHGDSITIDKISHDRAGTYQCMADNEIGAPAHAHIEISVTHKPTIKIEKMTVNSAEDYESQLTCIVHAEPKAAVVWRKDGSNIVSSKNLHLSHQANKYTLTIPKTKTTDFGNYTCSASNHLGRAEQVVTLSGTPGLAELVTGEAIETKGPVLTWTVESNSPITEYVLEYRKPGSTEWIDAKPEVTNPEGNIYTVKHSLVDLEPAEYETRLKSKNSYGWSPYSKIHHFSGELEPHHQHHAIPEEQADEDPASASTSGTWASTPLSLFVILSPFTLLNRCI